MYTVPPTVTLTVTAALIAGTVVQGVLAAPGAGSRYRLYGLIWSLARTVPAATIADFFLNDAGGNIIMEGGFSIPGKPSETMFFPYPGLEWDVNNLIDFQVTATAAGGIARLTLWYYTEDVS